MTDIQNLLIIEDGCPGKTELKAMFKGLHYGLCAPWAQDALRRALYNRMVGLPIPPYARQQVENAARHYRSTEERIEREAAQAMKLAAEQAAFQKRNHKRNSKAIERGRMEYAARMGTRQKKSK